MAGIYDDDIATAQELIAEFGQDCWWQKPAPVLDNSVPGYPTVGALPAPIPCKIAFFSGRDLNRGAFEFLSMMPGIEIPDNGEIGLLAGDLSFTPENPDTIRRGAVDAVQDSVDKIDRLAPNGIPILYYVQVSA